MQTRLLGTVGVAALLLGATAFAQTTAPTTPARPAPAATSAQQPDEVNLKRLIGRNIHNMRDETVGEIDSVIVDKDGKIQAVVVGVGGFLGIGERQVAINWDALEISQNGDRAVVNMSRDQVKALPEYKYADRSYRRSVFVGEPGMRTPSSVGTTGTNMANAQLGSSGMVGASKLVGLNVHNASNETIGEIKEILVAADGKIRELVVGVGGFLGMGERYVAIAWDEVQLRRDRDNDVVATVRFSKDQLKALPQYKYEKNAWFRG